VGPRVGSWPPRAGVAPAPTLRQARPRAKESARRARMTSGYPRGPREGKFSAVERALPALTHFPAAAMNA